MQKLISDSTSYNFFFSLLNLLEYLLVTGWVFSASVVSSYSLLVEERKKLTIASSIDLDTSR